MATPNLIVALITEVFFDDDGARLEAVLDRARAAGAELAVLPELPLNPWSPATTTAEDDDAEPPNGPRFQRQAEAARRAGIAVIGGVIEQDPTTGRRLNTALVFAADGKLLGRHRKTFLPEEEGFWETSHYEPFDEPPTAINGLAVPIGIQICSDANRPSGAFVLAAQGASAIFVPRATPSETYDRWRLILRASAVTATTFVVSVNRPGPERGVPIGAPSLAIAPDGEVLAEGTDQLQVITLEGARLDTARRDYPGYMPVRPEFWADAWGRIED